MIRYLHILILILLPILVLAQNNDMDVDAKGKIIPKTSVKPGRLPSKPEDVAAYFYSNIHDINKLDEIISFRFYQKTPYSKFKELLSQINNSIGKLLTKEIVKTEYSNKKNSIMFTIKATYEKAKTNGILYLIQESPGSRFEVYEYQLKKG